MEEEGGCDDLDQGDNGWKIIHTDVFRFPPYKSLLCAVLGVGAQFLTLATGEPSFSNTPKPYQRLTLWTELLCRSLMTLTNPRCNRNHHHGIAGNVQRAPPRRHQLCSHRLVRSDQLCVRLRVLQLLHADQRPALGVEHHPHLIALLR